MNTRQQTDEHWTQPPYAHLDPRNMYVPQIDEQRTCCRTHVSVVREEGNAGQSIVAEYCRDYSFLRTFEPFRQYRDGVWRDYALISEEYTRLAVLDLATGKVIAREAWPVVSQEMADRYPQRLTAGEERPDWGFCPAAFYVPDIVEEGFSEEDFTYTPPERKANEDNEAYDKRELLWRRSHYSLMTEFSQNYSGQFGLVAGCVWGDDSSMKARYVDLSRIQEGIVTADERFGYVPLAGDLGALREMVQVSDIGITLPVSVTFSAKTGEAGTWLRDSIRWSDSA